MANGDLAAESLQPGVRVLDVVGRVDGLGKLGTIGRADRRLAVLDIHAHLSLLSSRTDLEPAAVVESLGGHWQPDADNKATTEEVRAAADTLAFVSQFSLLCKDRDPTAMRSSLGFARRTLELTDYDLPMADYVLSTPALELVLDSIGSDDEQTEAEAAFEQFREQYDTMEHPERFDLRNGKTVFIPKDVIRAITRAIVGNPGVLNDESRQVQQSD